MHTTSVGKAFSRLVFVIAVLSIAACGGGGGGGSAPPGSKLFVADDANDAIGSLINANPAPNTAIPIDRIITGPSTNLAGNIPALVLDPGRDQLYVSNSISIFVFHGAGTASGNLVPNRRIATIPSAGNFNSMYLDTTHDVLYVGDSPNGVRVYAGASTLNDTGAPATLPNRTITGDFGSVSFSVRGVAVDVGRNILYVAVLVGSAASIVVFDGASALADGSSAPNRSFALPAAASDLSIFLDPNPSVDKLYVSGSSGLVWVFDNAHAADDGVTPVTPNRTINLNNFTFSKLTVDVANDRLYAMTQFLVYVINSVSTANGLVTAAAGVAPPGSSLSAITVRP